MKYPSNTALIYIAVSLFALGICIGCKYNVFTKKMPKQRSQTKVQRFKKIIKTGQPLTTFFTKDVLEYILTSYGNNDQQVKEQETGYSSYNWTDSGVDEETQPNYLDISNLLGLSE